MTRAELKAMAKIQINGKIGSLFVITLIIGLINGALSSIPGVGAAASIIVGPAFSMSIAMIYLNLARFPMYRPSVNDAFEGFKVLVSAIKVTLLVGLYTFLWSLLFIIPGIIKGISYSQALYIMAENPEMSAREAIRQSEQMMMGHKAEYFVLQLSFLGWLYLGVLTLGILYIWLEPYMQATMTNYYLYLKYGCPSPNYGQNFGQQYYDNTQGYQQ